MGGDGGAQNREAMAERGFLGAQQMTGSVQEELEENGGPRGAARWAMPELGTQVTQGPAREGRHGVERAESVTVEVLRLSGRGAARVRTRPSHQVLV